MTEIETLVTEWRDARLAILTVNWGDPVVAKAHVHLWTRLGHAEAALMKEATLVDLPDWPAPGCWPEPNPADFMMIDTSHDFTSWKPDPETGSFEVSEALRTDPDAAP